MKPGGNPSEEGGSLTRPLPFLRLSIGGEAVRQDLLCLLSVRDMESGGHGFG